MTDQKARRSGEGRAAGALGARIFGQKKAQS
jgi:hypothetical protein